MQKTKIKKMGGGVKFTAKNSTAAKHFVGGSIACQCEYNLMVFFMVVKV